MKTKITLTLDFETEHEEGTFSYYLDAYRVLADKAKEVGIATVIGCVETDMFTGMDRFNWFARGGHYLARGIIDEMRQAIREED